MSKRERVRRPRPQRTGPIRDWQGLLGSPGRRTEASTAGPSAEAAAPEDAVDRGVRLAYAVAQEKLEEGRRQARRHNDRPYGAWTMNGGQQDPTARLWATCNELTRTWMNLWLSAMGSMGSMGSAWMRAPGSWGTPAAGGASQVGFCTEIVGGSGSVSLTLEPGVDAGRLECPGLQPLDDKGKTLTDVSFAPGEGRELARVRVDVGGAKKGRYGGAILERDSKRPVGALTVTVSG